MLSVLMAVSLTIVSMEAPTLLHSATLRIVSISFGYLEDFIVSVPII
jgi:hypothetical protein